MSNVIGPINATGYVGPIEITEGGYKFTGTFATDGSTPTKKIKSMTCDIADASTNAKVGSLSIYFSEGTYATQAAVAGLIDDVLADIENYLVG